MHVHLDPVGGVAGDMFIAAALDAWPAWESGLREAITAAGLPAAWTLTLEAHIDKAIAGKRFAIQAPPAASERAVPTGTFRDIKVLIGKSSLSEPVKQHALGIFALLAEAEGLVHGVDPETVHFHEIADWDSVADIVGAAWLIDRIGAASSWSVGALPLGGGQIRTSHGLLPIPAPATARLLQGFETVDDGINGERVTPTGAAILAYIKPMQRLGSRGRLARTGIGLGTRNLPDRANMLRLLVWENANEVIDEQIGVIAFEIDDQTAEELAAGLDALRALPEVADVLQMPALGKKGRLTTHVQILCDPHALETVRRRCFLETTTLGLRWRIEQRAVLHREIRQQNELRVKTVTRPDGIRTAKAEIDDVRYVHGHAERVARRRAAEDTALTRPEGDD